MQYDFKSIEKKWRKYWDINEIYKVDENSSLPKHYVLDMFPYPSGAGLHVGHPLGYIASDIYARYKTLEGYNVLHPMGFDAFGLPAEQYAIQTGQHPAITTENNISTYKSQFDLLGISFDKTREFKTCDPSYYKWTQWCVIKFFESWYDNAQDKARPISELEEIFAQSGNQSVKAAHNCETSFSAQAWAKMTDTEKQDILLCYRLAYLAETLVNWCPNLGTVLANDEIKDGLSERGGHEIIQKKMKQWSLRVSAYAQRLLDGLDELDWSESIKEIQRNWIGRSEGAELDFAVEKLDLSLKVFTTRPDTVYGVTFMVLAPESDYTALVTSDDQKADVEKYVMEASKKSERDRQANVKNVTGVFSGRYCINPLTKEKIPIWISEYVLGSYGTGAIMAVPAHDERDFKFAEQFGLEIQSVYESSDKIATSDSTSDSNNSSLEPQASRFHPVPKDSPLKCITGELKGLTPSKAIAKANEIIKTNNLGQTKINFRLRDAIFSRQRYWGEPFPFYFVDERPYPVSEEELPVKLPEVDKFLPTETGEPPLARAKNWNNSAGHPLELSTMPGFAGSSTYFLRFMDPHNSDRLVSKKAVDYWQNVDLYIGGSEHATGHLIYARFWNMFLYDIGVASTPEPFKKMINQGMILGRSSFVYRKKGTNTFVSEGLKDQHDTQQLHVYVGLVKDDTLDIQAFKAWRPEFNDAEFILEDGLYKCGSAVEKMSKSMFNVVNPDDIVDAYGADTLRLYEMFLGPLEQTKPWSTSSIEGVHKFLGRFWRLFYDKEGFNIDTAKATPEELKILHTAIKKVKHDTLTFSFNTAISALMICVNDLTKLNCRKKEILEPLVKLLAPYCPHLCEELNEAFGGTTSIFKDLGLPACDDKYLQESTFSYPVSLNGKLKFLIELPINMKKEDVETTVLSDERTIKYIASKTVRKTIVVPQKIVNIVVG